MMWNGSKIVIVAEMHLDDPDFASLRVEYCVLLFK